MYHILAPQGHRQDRALLGEYKPAGLAAAYPPSLVERSPAVLARIGGVDQQVHLAGARGGFDPIGAVDQGPAARLEAQPVERRLAKRPLGLLAEIRRDLKIADLERSRQRALELALGIGRVELGPIDRNPRAAARSAGTDVRAHLAVG